MGVLAYLSTALCGARTRTESVLIMVSGADTRPVGRMNAWWIFSGFFGYTFVVLNLVGESVYPAVLAHRSNIGIARAIYVDVVEYVERQGP